MIEYPLFQSDGAMKMRVFVVMYNNGEGDRLECIFDSREAAEAFIEKRDYNWLYDYYVYDVKTLADVEK